MKLIQATVVPEDGISHPSYRTSLAEAFLFEFLQMLSETTVEFSGVGLNGDIDSQSGTGYGVEDCDISHSPPQLLPAKQTVISSSEHHPVGEPIAKTGAALQASGEAIYVDDIPSPADCLYGAFIYSTKPLARITGMRFKSGSPPNGVAAIICYKDIPVYGICRSDSHHNTIFIWRHKLHLLFQMKIIAQWSIVLFRLQNLHTLWLQNALGFLQTMSVSLREGLAGTLAERQYELCLLQQLVH